MFDHPQPLLNRAPTAGPSGPQEHVGEQIWVWCDSQAWHYGRLVRRQQRAGVLCVLLDYYTGPPWCTRAGTWYVHDPRYVVADTSEPKPWDGRNLEDLIPSPPPPPEPP